MRKTSGEWEKYLNFESDDKSSENINLYEKEYMLDWNWYIKANNLFGWKKELINRSEKE